MQSVLTLQNLEEMVLLQQEKRRQKKTAKKITEKMEDTTR